MRITAKSSKEAESLVCTKKGENLFTKLEYAHVICDILDTSRGYPTNEDKIFTTFCKKKKKVMYFLAPALTLTLTLTLTLALSLNHLANKQLQSSEALYSLINGIAPDLRTAPC